MRALSFAHRWQLYLQTFYCLSLSLILSLPLALAPPHPLPLDVLSKFRFLFFSLPGLHRCHAIRQLQYFWPLRQAECDAVSATPVRSSVEKSQLQCTFHSLLLTPSSGVFLKYVTIAVFYNTNRRPPLNKRKLS